MTTVAFVVHPERAEAKRLADRARTWLEANGHRAVEGGGASAGDDAGVAVAVSLGGDGTILRTVAWAAPRGIPVLGVNLGRLGYLTEVEPDQLEQALADVVAGRHAIERRMLLAVDVESPDGARQGSFVALNEAVVEKTVPGHTVRLHADIAGERFVTYAADGALVATPTGSTAYNLSVRGPVLSPRLRAMVVTPISSHTLFDRALVLEPEQTLTLTVAEPRPAVLVVDGVSVTTLVPGWRVSCRGAPEDAQLVAFGRRDFHAILRTRFGLTDR